MIQRLFNPSTAEFKATPQIASEVFITAPFVYDVIIISDIHLGSRMCQAQELDAFLSSIRVQYLILAGDVFDDLKFNRLQHWHWQALSRIRKISDHCRVVWIRGNHDIVSARTMSHLLGVDVKNHFTWRLNGKVLHVVHGDRWDTFIYKHQTLTAIVTFTYTLLQNFTGNASRRITKWLKKKAKLLTRNSDAVKYGALQYARKHAVDGIFCGHTHMAMLTKVDNVVYGNDGTWQSDDPHFIGIRGTNVSLCRYNNGKVVVEANEELRSKKFYFCAREIPREVRWLRECSAERQERNLRYTVPVRVQKD